MGNNKIRSDSWPFGKNPRELLMRFNDKTSDTVDIGKK